MDKNIFDEWNAKVDDAFLKAISDVDNSQETKFEPVPYGTYEVTLDTLMVKASKSGKAMLHARFRIVNDKRLIFYNQIIDQAIGISIAKRFLRSMGTDCEVVFEDYSQFDRLLQEIKINCEELKLSFELVYSEEKGYPKCEITNVFEN